MKIKKTLLVGGILLTSILGVANANGLKDNILDKTTLENRFVSQANILGVSVEEVKNAWSNNINIFELAAQKGISVSTLQTKIKEQKLLTIKTQLSNLVSSGLITQAQADQKYNKMSERINSSHNKKDTNSKSKRAF